MNTPIRHGDVLLFPVSVLPKGEEQKHGGSFTLALGEVTGHSHVMSTKKPSDMKVVKVGNVFFIETQVDIPLRHQEHKEIMIPKGKWVVGFEQEYDPFMKNIRRTID